LGRDSG